MGRSPRTVQSSTFGTLVAVAAMLVVASIRREALGQWATNTPMAPPQPVFFSPPTVVTEAAPAHPALVVGVGGLVLGGAMIPVGIGVGAGVADNGWEKASALIGAGVGLGGLGLAASIHGADDGSRRLRDRVAAGFGWFFTSLAAGGVGAGAGLMIGGEEAGRPVGGVLAASSLLFLAPGIPLLVHGERSVDRPPVAQPWMPGPQDVSGLPAVPPATVGETEMNSPAMVGIGSSCIILGGIGSFFGSVLLAAGTDSSVDGFIELGGALLGGSLGTAVVVGLPLVVVGAHRVPIAPSISLGPGGIVASGAF